MKYILLEENCGERDIDEFLRICKEIDVAQIMISADSALSWGYTKHTIYQSHIVQAASRLIEGAIKNRLPFTILRFLGDNNLKEVYHQVLAHPEVKRCETCLDSLLLASRVIFYGAGGNCEPLLKKVDELGLRKPDVIWDRKVSATEHSDKTVVAENYGCSLRSPAFETLDARRDAVLITITNEETNRELAQTLRGYGFDNFISRYDLELALVAKEARSDLDS